MGKYDAKGEGEVKANPRNMDDPIDRERAPVIDKLEYACNKAAETFGKDPRMGGFSFLGQPDIIEAVVSEMPENARKLQKSVVVGAFGDGDVVAWWVHRKSEHPIPIRVRLKAKSGSLHLLPDHLVLNDDMYDRRSAGEIRIALHKGENRLLV